MRSVSSAGCTFEEAEEDFFFCTLDCWRGMGVLDCCDIPAIEKTDELCCTSELGAELCALLCTTELCAEL